MERDTFIGLVLAVILVGPSCDAHSGVPVAAFRDVQLNALTAGTQERPIIGSDTAGHLFVAWRSDNLLKLRVFDGTGTPLTDEIAIPEVPGFWWSGPDLVVHPDGVALVTWRDDSSSWLQTFSSTGTALGPVTLVANGKVGTFPPIVKAIPQDGGMFLLAFVDVADTTKIQIRAVDSTGSWSGAPIYVDNATTVGTNDRQLESFAGRSDASEFAIVQADTSPAYIRRFDHLFALFDTVEVPFEVYCYVMDSQIDDAGVVRVFWRDGPSFVTSEWRSNMTEVPPLPAAASTTTIEDFTGSTPPVTVGVVMRGRITDDGLVAAGYRYTGPVPGYPSTYYGNAQAFLQTYDPVSSPTVSRLPADDDLSREYQGFDVTALGDGRIFVVYDEGYDRPDSNPVSPRDGDRSGVFMRRFCPPEDEQCLCPGSTGDADGDGVPDECDWCTNVGGERDADKGKLTAAERWSAPAPDSPLADNRLAIDLDFRLPAGTTFADLSVVDDGAHIRFESAEGEAVTEFLLPPGLESSGGHWRVGPRSRRFIHGIEFNGLQRFALYDRSSGGDGAVQMRLRARGGIWGVFGTKPPARVILTPGAIGAATRGCTEITFEAGDCTSGHDGGAIQCAAVFP